MECVLFDLDGTLIDVRIYRDIFPEMKEKLMKRLKISEKGLMQKARKLGFKGSFFDSGEFCRKAGLLGLYYGTLEKRLKSVNALNKEAKKIFAGLKKRKVKIGIVSNSMRKTIILYTKAYGLKPDFVFGIDDADCLKSTKYWKALIKKEKLDPKQCLIVGDSYKNDIVPTKRLGFNVFHLKPGLKLSEVLVYPR
jgi:FMN phosphatase YigB (HAD superfamily)